MWDFKEVDESAPLAKQLSREDVKQMVRLIGGFVGPNCEAYSDQVGEIFEGGFIVSVEDGALSDQVYPYGGGWFYGMLTGIGWGIEQGDSGTAILFPIK